MRKSLPIILKEILHKGFTLIELMIVIGIIGILSIIAIPQYNNYIARSQITEAINIFDGVKSVTEEFYATYGIFPTQDELSTIYPIVSSGAVSGNLAILTKYLDNVQVSGGTYFWVVVIQFKNANISAKLFHKTIGFSTPGVGLDGAAIKWNCFAATIERDLLPYNCKAIAAY